MNFTEKKRELLNTITTTKRRTDTGIPYDVFNNVPEALQIKKEHEGRRVWISTIPRTKKAWLCSFNGDEVKIKFQKGFDRDFLIEEVILHPKEWRDYV
jgi:hypothetical protein